MDRGGRIFWLAVAKMQGEGLRGQDVAIGYAVVHSQSVVSVELLHATARLKSSLHKYVLMKGRGARVGFPNRREGPRLFFNCER